MNLGTPNYNDFEKNRDLNYFNFNSQQYSNERNLLASYMVESINSFGVCCEFYIASYDTKFNPIFGEDGNRRFERSFNFMAYFKQPLENKVWTKDGIVGTDTFSMWCSKKNFQESSMVGNFKEYFPPKIGDIVKSTYNSDFYEITDLVENTVFLQSKQFSWEFVVRPFKDELIVTTEESKNSKIKDYTNKAKDIFDITNPVNVKAEKTMYKPKIGEKAQKNPWQSSI